MWNAFDNFVAMHTALTVVLLVFFIVWEISWKLLAMWRAAHNGHKLWFVLLMVINTMGLLPIVYILLEGKKKNV